MYASFSCHNCKSISRKFKPSKPDPLAPLSVPTFNLLTPYPGTGLYRQFEQEGRLLHKDWSRYNHEEVVFRPKQMTPEQLYLGWLQARKSAYTLPSIFSRVWRNPGRRLTNLAYNLLRKGPNDQLHHP